MIIQLHLRQRSALLARSFSPVGLPALLSLYGERVLALKSWLIRSYWIDKNIPQTVGALSP